MTENSDTNPKNVPPQAKPASKISAPKPKPGPVATKAQRAALMRADKMVIKRMRKR